MSLANTLRSLARPPWPMTFCIAALGSVISLVGAAPAALPAFCSATGRSLSTSGFADLLALALLSSSPLRLAVDWAVMLVAMMPPLLVMPSMHVWRSSLPRRRLRAVSGFVLAYASIWMAAGPVLVVLSLALPVLAGNYALAFALLIAAAWTASPWQREALNRSHRLPRIGLFGWASDRDAASFGARHAALCVMSCWPWMLVPLVAGPWHVSASVLAGAAMLAERLAPPDRPRWHLPTFLVPFRRPFVAMSPKRAHRHG